ncbi:transporter substrate-binding domain-containing protein [Rhodanobacter umsongensis]
MAFALPLTVRATVIRVAADDSYPPYLFLGPDGKARGYLVDEWALWQKRTGVQVELIATNWTNAQQMLLLGQADVIEMILKTPERTALYDFTALSCFVWIRSCRRLADPARFAPWKSSSLKPWA